MVLQTGQRMQFISHDMFTFMLLGRMMMFLKMTIFSLQPKYVSSRIQKSCKKQDSSVTTKCSLLAAFFQLLTWNFLIINNTAEYHEFSPPLISKPEVRHNPELVLTMYDLKPS